MRSKSDSLRDIKTCPSCRGLIDADQNKCHLCGYEYLPPVLTEGEQRMSFTNLTEKIDNAFFRLENFMEGRLRRYTSYDFNRAFTVLLFKAEEPENYNIKNINRISNYFTLLSQLRYDFDKTDYPNKDANTNDNFVTDMETISHIAWERAHEFTRFQTPDSHQNNSTKYSISDVISDNDTENAIASNYTKKDSFDDFIDGVFDGVFDGSISQIEQFKWAEKMTSGFQPEPLKILENDVSFFIFKKKEELESSFATAEIEAAIKRLENDNRPVPYRETPDLSKMQKGMGKEQIKNLPKSKYLDIEKLMFPYEFFTIYRFQNMLNSKIHALKAADPKTNTTSSSALETKLHASEILKMPLVENLSQQSKQELITKLAQSELPYQIALLATIGFTDAKINTTFKTKVQLIKNISALLEAVQRAVKGNINVLETFSKEDRKRYTSYLHIANAKDFIEKLK